MAEPSSTVATLDPSAVKESIEDRVSQPNGALISGRYRIEGVLGSGGMGTVYLAQHTHMRKRVALKMLHTETSQVPELVARFEREAVAMSRAEHPNIATATDFGRAENGAFFLVLEYIEGYSLREAFRNGPLEVRRVVHIGRQIASALERSHELGIIHRDLKPENIMLVSRQGDVDYVKILDFGLAKLAPETLEVDGEGSGEAITKHGSVFGTPRYMAPEQCVGEDVDGRADLYALGLILYEALAGVHPFDERDPRRMIKHQLFTPIPPMKTRAPAVHVPASLDALVMRLLEKPRGKRYASATALLTELAEVCDREGILPLEPSARLATPIATPRITPPGPILGRLPGAPARGIPSDAMATQDAPDAAATQDVFGSDSTQDGQSNATQSLSSLNATQDLSPSITTRPPESTADVTTRPPEPTADVTTRPPEPTADVTTRPPEPTADVTTRPPEPTADVTTRPPELTADVTQPPPPTLGPSRGPLDNVPTAPPQPMPTQTKLAPVTGAAGLPALLQRRPLLILIPVGLLALLLLVFWRRPSPQTPAKPAANSVLPSSAPVVPPTPATLTQAEIDRTTAAGAPALLQLQKNYPVDPRLPRALALAYIAQGNGLEALRWQVKALATAENNVYDGEIIQAATLAMNGAESAEPAIELLERDFGTRGVDVLLALVNKSPPGRAKLRLTKSLTQAEVRTHASPAALVAFDLQAATKCEAKRALLPRAAKEGDQRTLQQLKALTATRGCGVLSRSDCWPCLHKGVALRSAITAITARASLAH